MGKNVEKIKEKYRDGRKEFILKKTTEKNGDQQKIDIEIKQ